VIIALILPGTPSRMLAIQHYQVFHTNGQQA